MAACAFFFAAVGGARMHASTTDIVCSYSFWGFSGASSHNHHSAHSLCLVPLSRQYAACVVKSAQSRGSYVQCTTKLGIELICMRVDRGVIL